MSKYAPLTDFLSRSREAEIPLTFADIERITGQTLPASKQYPAWWSNNPSNNVMTKAWLAAGFQTERVDIGGERLVFRRVADTNSDHRPREAGELLSRLRRRLGPSLTIPSMTDLTAPSSGAWDAEA